jgi:predicted ATPase/DNA-binding SARP family transcriptional activator
LIATEGEVGVNLPWRIELFGGLQVRQGERVVARYGNHKGAALLAYLAYYRKRAHPREELVELFWPETPPEVGRHNLRQALLSIRRQLEPAEAAEVTGPVFLANRADLKLSPAVTIDVEEFEAGLKSAPASDPAWRAQILADAVDLYVGPLLPGFCEEWVFTERERLAEACQQALYQLEQFFQGAGELDRAVEYARRAVGLDPLREEAHANLIRLLLAAGRTADALGQYRKPKRLLRDELDSIPSEQTAALVRDLSGTVRAAPEARRPVSVAPTLRPAAPARLEPIAPLPVPPPVPRLPAPVTRFFGREEELEHVGSLLRDPTTRLITLTGPGGSGKTRLAIEAARRATEIVAGQVSVRGWFVPLADRTDARSLPEAIAEALQLQTLDQAPPLERVITLLGHDPQTPALLVLDNFEHLIEEGAAVVDGLIERVPSLTCLVTSRQRLDLEGEHEMVVAPLPVPPGATSTTQGAAGSAPEAAATMPSALCSLPDTLLQCPSVQLFVDRARASRPDFQVTARTAAAVARLCERLEGLPLALELAAARAQMLTPSQMLVQLEGRFDFLVSRRRDIVPRHRTLRAALSWSYELLSPELRGFFARLSVFHGRWTLEAAAALCGDAGVQAFGRSGVQEEQPQDQNARTPERLNAVLDYLTELRERSLIQVVDEEEEMSYRMLETLREFAAEQLESEEQAALRWRHAEYFLALVERAEPHFHGPDQATWLDRLEVDHDNFRAVLAWSLQQAAGRVEAGATDARHREREPVNRPLEIGLRLAALLHFYWYVRGHVSEGRRWLQELLEVPASGEPTAARAMALHGAAGLASTQGHSRMACTMYEESLAIWRSLEDPVWIADTLCQCGYAAERLGDHTTARARFAESLEICRQLNDRGRLALLLRCMGNDAMAQGDEQRARELFEESLALYRELGDKRGVAMMLGEMTHLALIRGEDQRAALLAEEHVDLARQLKDQAHLALSLRNLGHVARFQGDHSVARRLFEESLTMCRTLGGKAEVAELLAYLCSTAWAEGDAAAARCCMAECLTVLREIDDRHVLAGCLDLLASVAIAREAAGGLSPCTARRAARLLAAAGTLRGAEGTILWWQSERAAWEQCQAAVRAALGEEAFATAWAEGSQMTPEAALNEARRAAAGIF